MPIYPHPQLVEPHVSEPAIEEGVPYKRDGAFWWMTATQFLGAFNDNVFKQMVLLLCTCLLYTSPSPRDLSTSRMPSSA